MNLVETLTNKNKSLRRDIKVLYDGKYPNACRGTLIIILNDKIIYNENFCCHSTGVCYFEDDWSSVIEPGVLEWDCASNYDQDIQDAVREVLSEIDVCCGGCI